MTELEQVISGLSATRRPRMPASHFAMGCERTSKPPLKDPNGIRLAVLDTVDGNPSPVADRSQNRRRLHDFKSICHPR
jgi:hypothetical protein